ncbi:MAG: hypothetical protein J6C87_01125 [Bacteroides sp.]|nr:hypothetical protein [Bacteroides sp.]
MNGIVEETCFLPFNRFRDAGLTRLSSFRKEEYPQGEVVGKYTEEGKPTTPSRCAKSLLHSFGKLKLPSSQATLTPRCPSRRRGVVDVLFCK